MIHFSFEGVTKHNNSICGAEDIGLIKVMLHALRLISIKVKMEEGYSTARRLTYIFQSSSYCLLGDYILQSEIYFCANAVSQHIHLHLKAKFEEGIGN